jgi:hypothetical protein
MLGHYVDIRPTHLSTLTAVGKLPAQVTSAASIAMDFNENEVKIFYLQKYIYQA